jgi:light-regulated signal transduction histidine kinase (bacteriophytochrome)
LGNAIAEMQKKLHRYRNRMESLVEQRTEELKRSNEDLKQFAHIASHDLKEPVRKIRTFSSRLENETEKMSDKGRQYIDKIQSASERMTGIIDGILSFSMVNAYEETFDKVDMNEILDGIRSDLEVVIAQKHAKIVTANLPAVHGIPILIHQLFYNLVSNALKFTVAGRKPVITITGSIPAEGNQTGSTGKFVKFEIADNGIGFSQEHADKMFDLFTRLNSRDKYEGTGLGLALCKKIVERHNGFIYAEGKEGEGAVFTVVLPSHPG